MCPMFLHCISNICTHRGMVLTEGPTNRRTIKCPYHGRTFNLCGKLKYMPEFEQAENEVRESIERLMNIKGTKSVDYFHRRLGKIIWNKVGMARNEEGLKQAISEVQSLRDEFYKDLRIPGTIESFNPELDKANRVSDFLELGELMAKDALVREESCGGHFREEHQTEEGEAKRNDNDFTYVAAWEYKGEPADAVVHKEQLTFNDIELKQRSYK